jgi:hypothetical protein
LKPSFDRRRTLAWAVFVFPFLFLVFCLALKRLPGPVYFLLIQEDHLYENLQFAFYALACFWSFRIARRFYGSRRAFHAAMYFILAASLFFIAGEEISWGQRIFHYVVNNYFQTHNIQHEINIHNLGTIQDKVIFFCIFIGIYGGFGWILLKALRGKTRDFLSWFVPDWVLAPYFLPALLLNLYFLVNDIAISSGIDIFPVGRFIIYRDQEVIEFLQSLGFLLFVVFIARRQRLENAEPAAGSESPDPP